MDSSSPIECQKNLKFSFYNSYPILGFHDFLMDSIYYKFLYYDWSYYAWFDHNSIFLMIFSWTHVMQVILIWIQAMMMCLLWFEEFMNQGCFQIKYQHVFMKLGCFGLKYSHYERLSWFRCSWLSVFYEYIMKSWFLKELFLWLSDF